MGIDATGAEYVSRYAAELISDKRSTTEKALCSIADNLQVNQMELNNENVPTTFKLSKKGLRVSNHHQKDYGGTQEDLAKAIVNIKAIPHNSGSADASGNFSSDKPKTAGNTL